MIDITIHGICTDLDILILVVHYLHTIIIVVFTLDAVGTTIHGTPYQGIIFTIFTIGTMIYNMRFLIGGRMWIYIHI